MEEAATLTVDMFEFIDMTGALGCSVGPTLMVKRLLISQDSPYRSVRMATL